MVEVASTNMVTVITGASSGIGRATALALAGRGARLSLLARSDNDLAEVTREALDRGAADVRYFICDLRDETAVDRAIESTLDHFGRIDVLLNSAGLSLNGAVEGYSLDDWRTVIDTNLTGTFLTCRAVLPAMKRQGVGQIINISSGAGRNGVKDMSAYSASKFGVIGFTESLALEVRNHNIRVSVLLPGSVATDFSRVAKREGATCRSGGGSEDIGYSMMAEEVASVIVMMIDQALQAPQAWMSEVTLRPLNLELSRARS